MKPRKLIAPLTILFIFLSGCLLQTVNFLGVEIDAVSGATKSDYGSGDYDRFYRNSGFRLPQTTTKSFLSMKKKQFTPFW